MVGLVRFEATKNAVQVTAAHGDTKKPTMHHTSDPARVELRRKLVETENARRILLWRAFLDFKGETSELTNLLFLEASPETLVKFEALLTGGAE